MQVEFATPGDVELVVPNAMEDHIDKFGFIRVGMLTKTTNFSELNLEASDEGGSCFAVEAFAAEEAVVCSPFVGGSDRGADAL